MSAGNSSSSSSNVLVSEAMQAGADNNSVLLAKNIGQHPTYAE
jgi:hypothetical protein